MNTPQGGGFTPQPTPNFGAVLKAYQPTMLQQLVQAAGQFPEQQQQAQANKLQLEMGQQQMKSQQQNYAMNQQTMQANDAQMKAAQQQQAQQQLAWAGKIGLNNPSAAKDPNYTAFVTQLAGQNNIPLNTIKNPDGTVNLDFFKQEMPQAEYARLMSLPQSMRMGQLNIDKQTMRIGTDSMHNLINGKVQMDPQTQASLDKLTAAAAASYSEVGKNNAEASKARADAAVAPYQAQSLMMRGQAALSSAGAAWARAQKMGEAGSLSGSTTLLTQMGQDLNTADKSYHDAQSALATTYQAYGVKPTDPDAQQLLLDAISKKYHGDPKSYQDAVNKVSTLQAGITSGHEQVQQLRDRLMTMLPTAQTSQQQAYLTGAINFSANSATLEPIGAKKPIKTPPQYAHDPKGYLITSPTGAKYTSNGDGTMTPQ